MDPVFMSPKRSNGYVINPDTLSNSPASVETGLYPWNLGLSASKPAPLISPVPGIPPSPATPVNNGSLLDDDKDRLKRGRPRADIISSLIVEGAKAESNHKCTVCNRNFPREKSLQAHMRTHTGEFLLLTL
jgi:uncharacterized Zn-finger protein